MDIIFQTVFNRALVCIIVMILSVHLNAISSHKKTDHLCSKVLFSQKSNVSSTNGSDALECTCKSKREMICPNLGPNPLTIMYNKFRKEISFTINNKRSRKFEVVIPDIERYIKLAQPRSLQISMCCNKESTQALSRDSSSNHSEYLSILFVKDVPSPSTLRRLDLNDNCFVNILGNFESAFNHLQQLDLSGNFFTDIPPGAFASLKQLQKLILSRNRIENLTHSAFEGLAALRDLRLDSNRIESVTEDVFKGLPNLRYLHFGSNKLQMLPEGIFHSNGQLKAITFECNALKSLPRSILSHLQNLVFFSAYDNQLDSIPAEIFKGLSELQEVRLNKNQLQHIPPDLFETNGIVTRIDISKNNLTDIPALNINVLSDSPIESIRLLNNNITSLNLPMTNYISTYVEVFDISGNCFQHVDVQETETSYSNDDASGVFNLVCRGCCLKSISKELLKGVIDTVDLSNNLVDKIDMDSLKSIVNLRSVDLSHNRIANLNLTHSYPLIKEVSNRTYERLDAKINLRGNPINCDCNIVPLLSLYRPDVPSYDVTDNRSNIRFLINDVTCAKPPALHGRRLMDFVRFPKSTEQILCNYTAFLSEQTQSGLFTSFSANVQCWDLVFYILIFLVVVICNV